MSEHPPELVEKVRDVLAGWPIGTGYYGTAVGTVEASDMARAALDAIGETHWIMRRGPSYQDQLCDKGCDCGDCFGEEPPCPAPHHRRTEAPD